MLTITWYLYLVVIEKYVRTCEEGGIGNLICFRHLFIWMLFVHTFAPCSGLLPSICTMLKSIRSILNIFFLQIQQDFSFFKNMQIISIQKRFINNIVKQNFSEVLYLILGIKVYICNVFSFFQATTIT